MTEQEKYALEWNNSAQYFYEQESYKQLAMQIKKYQTVLEIGCGTGQSTLALLEAGHSVIAIDQNPHCIETAKKLIEAAGYAIQEDSREKLAPQTVCFIECDVTEESFETSILPNMFPDVIVCWNIGSYWDESKLKDAVPKMLEYGLTIEQISANPESSYGELILWRACGIAKAKACAIQLVERGTRKITKLSDPYYKLLKQEFSFDKIKYSNIKAKTLSTGGRKLITNGTINEETEIMIFFISILMR